jgi:hypothetical protein
MGGPGSGRKKGSRNGSKKINVGTDFSKQSKIHTKMVTIGRKGSKTIPTGRVKISKAALKRREERYGKEAASKMSKWSE